MTALADPKRCLVVGNWKMNGTLLQAEEFARKLVAALVARPIDADLVICPPATLLADLSVLFAGWPVALGAQDCNAAVSGAYTGEISAAQLVDCGADYVIVGHSERRHYQGETDAVVAAKATAAVDAGLIAIICVGESAAEREQGRTLDVIARQLAGSVPSGLATSAYVVAYEPVWAIGAGSIPSEDEIASVHGHIISKLRESHASVPRVLYGGSVKPDNAASILNIDGVSGLLVGGASLDPMDFLAVAAAHS
jgi:triosephosphate isomerase